MTSPEPTTVPQFTTPIIPDNPAPAAPQQRTQAELDDLKDDWERDPNWDIETTRGFEAHRDELLAYRLKREADWKAHAAARELRTNQAILGVRPFPVEIEIVRRINAADYAQRLNAGWAVSFQWGDGPDLHVCFIRATVQPLAVQPVEAAAAAVETSAPIPEPAPEPPKPQPVIVDAQPVMSFVMPSSKPTPTQARKPIGNPSGKVYVTPHTDAIRCFGVDEYLRASTETAVKQATEAAQAAYRPFTLRPLPLPAPHQ